MQFCMKAFINSFVKLLFKNNKFLEFSLNNVKILQIGKNTLTVKCFFRL